MLKVSETVANNKSGMSMVSPVSDASWIRRFHTCPLILPCCKFCKLHMFRLPTPISHCPHGWLDSSKWCRHQQPSSRARASPKAGLTWYVGSVSRASNIPTWSVNRVVGMKTLNILKLLYRLGMSLSNAHNHHFKWLYMHLHLATWFCPKSCSLQPPLKNHQSPPKSMPVFALHRQRLGTKPRKWAQSKHLHMAKHMRSICFASDVPRSSLILKGLDRCFPT